MAEEYKEMAVTRGDRAANARRLNPDYKSRLAGEDYEERVDTNLELVIDFKL